jgi:polyhydroxyalkanoate synthesis regulator phasin
MDFVPTTKFQSGRSFEYKFPPKRVLFEEYEPQKLVSGLVTHTQKKLETVEAKLKTNITQSRTDIDLVRTRVDNFVSLTFVIVAILFAAISVFGFGGPSPPWHYIGVFLLSGFATFLAASAWLKSKSEGQLFGRSVQAIIAVGLSLAFVFNYFTMRKQQGSIEELRREVQALKLAPPTSSPISPSLPSGQPAPSSPNLPGQTPSARPR